MQELYSRDAYIIQLQSLIANGDIGTFFREMANSNLYYLIVNLRHRKNIFKQYNHMPLF